MSDSPSSFIEPVYECLAEGIDRAGPRHEALFLAKLALTLAHEVGDVTAFRRAVETALQDLDLGATTFREGT